MFKHHHYRCHCYWSVVVWVGNFGFLWDGNCRHFEAERHSTLLQGGVEDMSEDRCQMVSTVSEDGCGNTVQALCFLAAF